MGGDAVAIVFEALLQVRILLEPEDDVFLGSLEMIGEVKFPFEFEQEVGGVDETNDDLRIDRAGVAHSGQGELDEASVAAGGAMT